MAYQKNTPDWSTGLPITATRMNHIEDGIESISLSMVEADDRLDKIDAGNAITNSDLNVDGRQYSTLLELARSAQSKANTAEGHAQDALGGVLKGSRAWD